VEAELSPQQKAAITRRERYGDYWAGGAPSKYKPEFCQKAVEIGNDGGSIEEIAHEIGVVPKTIYNWMDEHEEFFHAITRAKLAELVWWEKKGRNGLTADRFNASVWSRSMAARFPDKWRETSRQEQTGLNGGPIKTVAEQRVLYVNGVKPEPDAT
jgi:transposase-like protein